MANYINEFDPRMTATINRIISAYSAAKPISRTELVNKVKAYGYQTNERSVRDAIKYLRRAGSLICSAPGNNGGYYMARNMDEFNEFDQVEFGAKIADMAETRAAMKRAAVREFGEMQQIGLF
jgi:DNA-binding transcriptional regulator PaaX